MRIIRAVGLVTLGVLIGAGATWTGTALRAQVPSGRLALVTGIEYAGNYPFRFLKDTKTGTCYLVGLSGGSSSTTITAITATDAAACF
jgi:hypothetical protein